MDAIPPPSFEIVLDQHERGYQNTGIIILRDPETGEELGRYKFTTGGFGRGSAPHGTYQLGAFRGLDDDPNHIGTRWMLREPERNDGEVYDPKIKAVRSWIELHRASRAGTLGCIGVLASPTVWDKFVDNVNSILAKIGQLAFSLSGNPEAKEVSEWHNLRHVRHKVRTSHHKSHKRDATKKVRHS